MSNIDLNTIVTNGLCIGCGLCASIVGSERVQLVMTAEGRERPIASIPLDMATNQRIQAVCPGTQIHGMPAKEIEPDADHDDVWGVTMQISRGYAADPDVRFRGSTGGVLTALAIYLLESKRVEFVAHVAADKNRPMRTVPQISTTRADVLQAAGSRYGPAAPLTHFLALLDRQQPFAFVGKPCDISAIRNSAKLDERVDEYCNYLLTIVCGGASELTKSWEVLDDFGVSEDELSVFRYRGYGNPGLTRLETKDGRAFELTYGDLWKHESKWRIQSRCKICADAIGDSADIVATDVWPGASPTGEDAGFNGILTRTRRGLELVEAAVRDGALIIDREYTAHEMDDLQPHQVRKKKALRARLEGLRKAGNLVPEVSGLRIDLLNRQNSAETNQAESDGIQRRVREGKFNEPQPKSMEQS